MAITVYLKLTEPAITGGATDPAHAGEIQLLSWSHSFNAPMGTGEDGARGTHADHTDLIFTKYIDSATDDLLKLCWNGQQIGSAVLSCYRSDGDEAPSPYLRVEMEDALVTNVSIGGGGGDLPTETISLAYRTVTYTYAAPAPAAR